jgi:hypothetical protein
LTLDFIKSQVDLRVVVLLRQSPSSTLLVHYSRVPELTDELEPTLYPNRTRLTLVAVHKLNMELDLQSLFGLHVHSCTH